MNFNTGYAIMFGLAGFAAAAYHLKSGDQARYVPFYAVLVCITYSAATYGFIYAFLTAIEFAIGFGIAHAAMDKATGAKTATKSEES